MLIIVDTCLILFGFALSSSLQDMSKSVQEFKMNGPAKETGQRDNMVAFEECVSHRFYQVPHIDTNPLKTTSLTVRDIQPCYVVSSTTIINKVYTAIL